MKAAFLLTTVALFAFNAAAEAEKIEIKGDAIYAVSSIAADVQNNEYSNHVFYRKIVSSVQAEHIKTIRFNIEFDALESGLMRYPTTSRDYPLSCDTYLNETKQTAKHKDFGVVKHEIYDVVKNDKIKLQCMLEHDFATNERKERDKFFTPFKPELQTSEGWTTKLFLAPEGYTDTRINGKLKLRNGVDATAYANNVADAQKLTAQKRYVQKAMISQTTKTKRELSDFGIFDANSFTERYLSNLKGSTIVSNKPIQVTFAIPAQEKEMIVFAMAKSGYAVKNDIIVNNHNLPFALLRMSSPGEFDLIAGKETGKVSRTNLNRSAVQSVFLPSLKITKNADGTETKEAAEYPLRLVLDGDRVSSLALYVKVGDSDIKEMDLTDAVISLKDAALLEERDFKP